MEKVKVESHTSSGLFWIAGWIFTIGFVGLSLVQSIYAIVIWPYYLGRTLSPFIGL